MTDLGKADWWDSSRRNRMTLLCVSFVAITVLFLVLSPRGWVGLATGLFVGGLNMFLSLHPDSRFYPGRLGTSQPRGPELYPRVLYRILLFAAGTFVIWDSVWQFLHPRG